MKGRFQSKEPQGVRKLPGWMLVTCGPRLELNTRSSSTKLSSDREIQLTQFSPSTRVKSRSRSSRNRLNLGDRNVAGWRFFGEGCLAGHSLYSVSAIASPSYILSELKKIMAQMLHEGAAFSEMFLAFLLSRNSQIEADRVDLLLNSSEKRLARTILILADFGNAGDVAPIISDN